MGTPLPPNEAGDVCAICFGAGQEFGDVPTPTFIMLQLEDLQQGPFWDPAFEQQLLTPHQLIQTVNPCGYTVFDGTFNWSFTWFLTTTLITIVRTSNSKQVFANVGAPVCGVNFSNALESTDNEFAFGGSLEVTWLTGGLS